MYCVPEHRWAAVVWHDTSTAPIRETTEHFMLSAFRACCSVRECGGCTESTTSQSVGNGRVQAA